MPDPRGQRRRYDRRWAEPLLAVVALVLAAAAVVALARIGTGQQRRDVDIVTALAGSPPQAGEEIIIAAGCGACHEIPGVRGARGKVGPSLAGVAGRAVIAGHLPNAPDSLAAWIEDPRRFDPDTAMPALGLSRQQAREVTAWLYARAQ